jgi:hypothetical protein
MPEHIKGGQGRAQPPAAVPRGLSAPALRQDWTHRLLVTSRPSSVFPSIVIIINILISHFFKKQISGEKWSSVPLDLAKVRLPTQKNVFYKYINNIVSFMIKY